MLETLRDMAEQPQILLENAGVIGNAYECAGKWADDGAQVVMTGMATSFFAWHSAGIVLRGLGRPPMIVEASEYLHYSRADDDQRPLFVLSRSGELAEIVGILEGIDQQRLVVGLTEGRDNRLARRAQTVLSFAARERAFWNTKSFLTSLALALSIAGGLAGQRDLAPGRWLETVSAQVAGLLEDEPGGLASAGRLIAAAGLTVYVARGHLLGIAQNGAVDLQEGMRLAVLPLSGGVMRHGPMELALRKDAAFLILIPADRVAATMARLAADIVQRGARVVVIAAGDMELPPGITAIRLVATAPELSPMIFAVALQLLNVAVARALGVETIRPATITKITRVE